MKTTAPLTPEQERLIADYMANESDGASLLEACQDSDAVKHELAELTAIDRLMQQHYAPSRSIADSVMQGIAAQAQHTNNVHTLPTQKSKPKRRSRVWLATAASIVLCLTAALVLFTQPPSSMGRVTNFAGVAPNNLELNQTVSGQIRVDQGFRELTLNNGVILIVEAPAQLNIISEDRVILEQGTLVAKVPPNATGFRVDTPSSEIIDLGTVFGVSVNDNGDSRLQVIEGEVKARASENQDFELLTTNQARYFDQQQQAKVIASSPDEFMRALPGQSAQSPNYLHWSFDRLENGQINDQGNRIGNTEYPAYDRTDSAPLRLSDGKFGKAATLNGKDNWLETDFPGIGGSDPRTVAFWVKVPEDFSNENAYGIVSWGVQKDRASWQISPNPETVDGPIGRLRIGTYYGQIVGNTDLRDNQWHHIAIVLYGGDSADLSTHVLLYVDGVLEHTAKKSIGHIQTDLDHPQSKPLSIGRNIGYNPYDTDEPQKFFKGAVDEMYVFDTALSQAQVQGLMQTNQLP